MSVTKRTKAIGSITGKTSNFDKSCTEKKLATSYTVHNFRRYSGVSKTNILSEALRKAPSLLMPALWRALSSWWMQALSKNITGLVAGQYQQTRSPPKSKVTKMTGIVNILVAKPIGYSCVSLCITGRSPAMPSPKPRARDAKPADIARYMLNLKASDRYFATRGIAQLCEIKYVIDETLSESWYVEADPFEFLKIFPQPLITLAKRTPRRSCSLPSKDTKSHTARLLHELRGSELPLSQSEHLGLT
mmetsp:Transcript_31145/g.66105  ORF Transcript_31145/g.66105 Transcript_31145/m.66105 type:complete len:247 (-) Transcript_31145:287-1027(-)